MDCIGSPTTNTVRPSPGVQPAVSAASRFHWLRDVSWNSSTSTCDRRSSRASSRSVGADSVPSACTAPAAICAWSTSPRSAKTTSSCAAATGKHRDHRVERRPLPFVEPRGRQDGDVGKRLPQPRRALQRVDQALEFVLGAVAPAVLLRREAGRLVHRLAPVAVGGEQEGDEALPARGSRPRRPPAGRAAPRSPGRGESRPRRRSSPVA